MYNFKDFQGTFKGLAGECFFKLSQKNAFLTRFHPKRLILEKHAHVLTKAQSAFLDQHWFSLDAIEFQSDGKTVLYEVKTRNYESYALGWPSKITAHLQEIYPAAKELGFLVKVATILLHAD